MIDFVVKNIVDLFKSAERPIILIDACAVRYGVQKLSQELIETAGVPFFTTVSDF